MQAPLSLPNRIATVAVSHGVSFGPIRWTAAKGKYRHFWRSGWETPEDTAMRYSEICHRPAMTDEHPFVCDVVISPTVFSKFDRAMEDRQDVRLLARIDQADRCLVHVGCSSLTARRRLLDAWG
jgi:hypothetical protein